LSTKWNKIEIRIISFSFYKLFRAISMAVNRRKLVETFRSGNDRQILITFYWWTVVTSQLLRD
jgi:hypothetical protein